MSLDSRFSWIDLKDSEQVSWAVSYLIGKGIIEGSTTIRSQPQSTLHSFIEQISTAIQHSDSTELLIRKMKTAWSQKKNRSHLRGKKGYTFVMSSSIGDKLKRLSGKTPVNQALEMLIDDIDSFRKGLKKEHDELMEKRQGENKSPFTASKNSKAQIDKLTAIQNAEEKLIKDLLFQNLKKETLLRKNNITDEYLTEDEISFITKSMDKSIDFYKKSIESEIGVNAFLSQFANGNIAIFKSDAKTLSSNLNTEK